MENKPVKLKFAFREAVERQDHTTLKLLITNSVGAAQIREVVAKEQFDGFTALQRACLVSNKKIAMLFIDYGVDIDQPGKYGWTALHSASFACKQGNDISIVLILLNSCANVAARDDHGCLPIDLAENRAVADALLAKMEAKGYSGLVDMYRKLKYRRTSCKNDIVKQWVEDGRREAMEKSENKESKTEKLRVTKSFSIRNLDSSCFYTACEKRAQFLSDRSTFRQDSEFGRRRVVSWDVKRKRDSGISVDTSNCFTFI